MNVAVLGAGALATLFAARLSRSGADVTVAGTWTDGLQALSSAATVEEGGATWSAPVRAVPRETLGGSFDLVLVLVKAWATADVSPVVGRLSTPLVLTLQNGLGNREILAAHTSSRVSAGLTTNGATLLGPGRVRAFPGDILLDAAPALDDAAGLFQQAGLATGRTETIERALWEKLAVNCAINPLTALLGVTNGELARREEWATAEEAAREVQRVASVHGIHDEADWAGTARRVAEATSANRSSMLQDVDRGRPTEIEALCGYVVREAGEVAVPVNRRLAEDVRSLRATGEESPCFKP